MNTTTQARQPAATSPLDERLCHLFRVSLQQGRIHPLYLPMLKYRQSRAEAAG